MADGIKVLEVGTVDGVPADRVPTREEVQRHVDRRLNRAEMRAALERLRDRYLDEDNAACAMDLRMLLDAYRLPEDPA